MRFIDWNYDEMIAIEYERSGECNGCGECCMSKITFKGNHEGTDGPNEIGTWSEFNANNDGSGDRLFFKPYKYEEFGNHVCPEYKNGCKIYLERPAICSSWPLSPRDVIQMPSCSYVFDEINSWKIE